MSIDHVASRLAIAPSDFQNGFVEARVSAIVAPVVPAADTNRQGRVGAPGLYFTGSAKAVRFVPDGMTTYWRPSS